MCCILDNGYCMLWCMVHRISFTYPFNINIIDQTWVKANWNSNHCCSPLISFLMANIGELLASGLVCSDVGPLALFILLLHCCAWQWLVMMKSEFSLFHFYSQIFASNWLVNSITKNKRKSASKQVSEWVNV